MNKKAKNQKITTAIPSKAKIVIPKKRGQESGEVINGKWPTPW